MENFKAILAYDKGNMKAGTVGMAHPDKFSASKKGWCFVADGQEDTLLVYRDSLRIMDTDGAIAAQFAVLGI